jgi:hypothetical protein
MSLESLIEQLNREHKAIENASKVSARMYYFENSQHPLKDSQKWMMSGAVDDHGNCYVPMAHHPEGEKFALLSSVHDGERIFIGEEKRPFVSITWLHKEIVSRLHSASKDESKVLQGAIKTIYTIELHLKRAWYADNLKVDQADISAITYRAFELAESAIKAAIAQAIEEQFGS